MSEQGCTPQNDLPNPEGLQTDDQLPPVQYESEPIYEDVSEDHKENLYMDPDPLPPPAGFQTGDQPTPVQPIINPSVPLNTVPYITQPYKGYPVQSYLPHAIPQTAGPGPVPPVINQPLPVQTVVNPSSPSNPLPHQVQSYTVQNYPPNAIPQTAGPGPVPPNMNQPIPVQTVVNPSSPSNPLPHQVQSYTGYPVQNYPPNAIPQTAGPGPVPPADFGVQTVMNPSSNPAPQQVQSYTVQMPQPGQHTSAYPVGGYPVQNYPPNAIPQTAGPGPIPPADFGVQTVMNPSSNPAPQQAQSYTVQMPQPGQHTSAYPVGGNHPPPVQILDQSSPCNPASHHIQSYAAPAVPPAGLLFGVPPGLEYFTQIDQILVHQKMECIEILSGFETNNQYEVKNSMGQEIYHAKEESDCIIRNLFGPAHGFKMHIKNNMDQEVIQLHRPMRCLLQELEVQAPPGVTIGYVKQEWSCLPKFSILGPNFEELLKIQGPFLPFKCCGEIDFEVISIIGEQSIGRITKQRSGLLKKCISDVSNFCIQFPLDMDVKMKAALLGACLFIDILYFEKGGFLLLKLLKM